MTTTWKEALAYWNQCFNTGKYKIPKKGTPEYDEIHNLMKEDIPSSFKTTKVEPKEPKEPKQPKKTKKLSKDPALTITHEKAYSEPKYVLVPPEHVKCIEIDWTSKTEPVEADEVLE